jgi:uncharacterized protein YbdZ (MbtH family)
MENYLLNNLIIKIAEPASYFEISHYALLRTMTISNMAIPSLLVVAKTEELDSIEAMLNEIVAEYTQNDKLFVFLVDGVKANILNAANNPIMQDAWLLSGFGEAPMSGSFFSAKDGRKMTTPLLKSWLDFEMGFLKRRCPEIYSDEYQVRTYYSVFTNNKGDYKIWFAETEHIPQGWEIAYSYTGDKQDAIEDAKRLRAEYLERVAYEAQNQEEDPDEAYRKAWKQADEDYRRQMNN